MSGPRLTIVAGVRWRSDLNSGAAEMVPMSKVAYAPVPAQDLVLFQPQPLLEQHGKGGSDDIHTVPHACS